MLSITMSTAKYNMSLLDLPTATMARLLSTKTNRSISASSLSAALREVGRLSSDVEAELLTITKRLLEYKAAFEPLPLPKSAEELTQLLVSVHTARDVDSFISLTFARESKLAKA